MKLKENMHLPAYPLLIKDPYFSIWTTSDKLNESNTIFWHGEQKPIYGYITVDGKKYCFMGLDEDALKLEQISMEVKALSTIYHFKNDEFSFDIEFLSPLTLSNLILLACPVCYINYTFNSSTSKNVEIQLIINQEICYNTSFENVYKECRGNRFKLSSFECVSIALERQLPLSQSNDEDGADWGVYYLTGDKCDILKDDNKLKLSSRNLHSGSSFEGTFLVAFDDLLSIFYYGEYLKGYYFTSTNKNIFDAIEDSYKNIKLYKDICEQEEQRLIDLTSKYDEKTYFVLLAGYRQSIGAHKLVENSKKQLLFLSKECNSDGCIATVDITYPSMPLYLLLNPELVKGMLIPIFDFARFPIWDFDYAPHDAGIYPYCLGQYYAVASNENEQLDLHVHDWHKATLLPFYYQFPKGTPIFDENRQMPIEESGNMIIATYLYFKVSKDYSFINENIDLLNKWVKYLINKGLRPGNQLCTDDFAGHLDGNANLAIKAIVGINAFAEINKMIGKIDEYEKYYGIAKDYSIKWMEIYFKGDHSVLSPFKEDSYSLKYNLAIDLFLDNPLFDKLFKEIEVKYYLTKKNRYGIPLDTRNTYTKTDWMAWVCCLTDDIKVKEEIFECMFNFLCDSQMHVPFSDWIETIEPTYHVFRNRTVQGGLFLPILLDNWSKLCQK